MRDDVKEQARVRERASCTTRHNLYLTQCRHLQNEWKGLSSFLQCALMEPALYPVCSTSTIKYTLSRESPILGMRSVIRKAFASRQPSDVAAHRFPQYSTHWILLMEIRIKDAREKTKQAIPFIRVCGFIALIQLSQSLTLIFVSKLISTLSYYRVHLSLKPKALCMPT